MALEKVKNKVSRFWENEGSSNSTTHHTHSHKQELQRCLALMTSPIMHLIRKLLELEWRTPPSLLLFLGDNGGVSLANVLDLSF